MSIQEQINTIRSKLENPIVVIGMMGAGKTTLGHRLADMLNYKFLDSDQEIEKEQGVSIQEIFRDKGEAYYRDIERRKILSILSEDICIISVGGGAIVTEETAEAIFAGSLCLWVDAPVDKLIARVGDASTRPLLDKADIQKSLTNRMVQRRHIYERAHIHIDGAPVIDKVAENAIGQIHEYLLKRTP